MGQLLYGNTGPGIEFQDRLLAHLQIAIVIKLRRGEAFGFSFDHGRDASSGRTALWLAPAIPLQFVYMDNRDPSMNRVWLESLVASSNSATGLRIVEEPTPQLVA